MREYEDEQKQENSDQHCDASFALNHFETAFQHSDKNGLASVVSLASWSEFDKETFEEKGFTQEVHE